MSSFPSNFYALARERCGAPADLHDRDGIPPERLLQAIWLHQRLQRDRLRTLDGQPVLVLHPGFANAEGGPDFRDALVRLGEAVPLRGDVEVDLRPGGWQAHGHNRNPDFQTVVLHVVWDTGQMRSAVPAAAVRRSNARAHAGELNPHPPIVAIKDALDAPLGELARWLGSDAARAWPEQLQGRCCAPLSKLASDRLQRLLHEAAMVRLHGKAAQLQARARLGGWEQALWEGLFRALGYKHNAWPMQWLAEQRPRWNEGRPQLLQLQARLLGLSGLLPADLDRTVSAGERYVRQVWDHWWRDREMFADCILPRSAWHSHGLRPANHPQRRLALAAHWIVGGELVNRLESWCVTDLERAALVGSLLAILQVERDDFWSWHWTFRSPRLARPQPLLGESRATDLAVNVILPWLWMRAAEGGSEAVRRTIEARYLAWSAAEDNSLLRLARRRLLGGTSGLALRGAAAQQGLLQILHDFCSHANALCDGCRFPEVVRDWPACEAAPTPA